MCWLASCAALIYLPSNAFVSNTMNWLREICKSAQRYKWHHTNIAVAHFMRFSTLNLMSEFIEHPRFISSLVVLIYLQQLHSVECEMHGINKTLNCIQHWNSKAHSFWWIFFGKCSLWGKFFLSSSSLGSRRIYDF